MENNINNLKSSDKTIDLINQLEHDKSKTKKRFLINIIIVFILMFVIFCFVFKNINIDNAIMVLQNINLFYFALSIFTVFLFWILTAYSFHIIVRSLKFKISTRDSMAIGSSVMFFNGITPFSSGGQPFQIYYLKRLKVPLSKSTGATLMNFIIYQISLTVISLAAVMIYYDNLKDVPNFKKLVVVGILINTLVLLFLIFISFSSKFKKIIVDKLITGLIKIKFLNKYLKINEKFKKKSQRSIDRFQVSFIRLLRDKKTLVWLFIVRTISLLCFYAVAFFVLKAINIPLDYTNLLMIISLSAFALVFTAWVPTPGASGGAEFAFLVLFTQIDSVTPASAAVGLLLWRFVTYYLSLFWGLFAILIFEKGRK